ncbi:VCBS repeat-containing protein [bacterium]|nr:VCBS repeat-containing protein [candidate division CSSED10-310 bacterium]
MRGGLISGVIMVTMAWSSAQAEQGSRIRDVRIAGCIHDLRIMQLDEDPWLDLVVLSTIPGGSVVLQWLPGGAGGFSADSTLAVDLGPAAGVALADYTGDGRPEILRWTDAGIDARTLPSQTSQSRTLNLLLPAERSVEETMRWRRVGPPRFLDLFMPLDDSTSLFMAPRRDGFDLWAARAGKVLLYRRLAFQAIMTARLDGSGALPATSYVERRPSAWQLDLDGDGDLDILGADQDRLITYVNSGGFQSAPDRITLLSAALDPTTTELLDQRMFCLDLNADGMPDLVRSSFGYAVHGAVSSREIHRGRAGGVFTGAPDLRHVLPGLNIVESFLDADGDGSMEMLASRVPLSADGITDSLARGLVPYFIELYKLGGEGYERRPTDVLPAVMTYPQLGPPRPAAVAVGDFNGDRRPDLAVPAGDECRIYWNRGEKLFKKGECARVPMTSSRLFMSRDLDGDGRTDLVGVHWPSDDISVIQVLISRFPPNE